MSEDEGINYVSPNVKDEADLPIGLKSLFTYAFTLNCHLDDASITNEEKETLLTLDILEVFENFKDLVLDLLKFKQKFKNTDMAELANRSDQFETMIQKLEAKVRTHIGIEQQLKLHIESTQSQYEELEKLNTQLKKGNNSTNSEKCNCEKHENDMKTIRDKLGEIEKDCKKKDAELVRLTSENLKLRKILEDKSRQMHLLKKAIKPKGDFLESNEYIKKQIEEQNSEIIKIQQKLKKDIYGWSFKKPVRQKSTKRSNSPTNGSQYISPAFKIAQKYIRGHIRSFSEH